MLQEVAALASLALDSLKSIRLTRSNRTIIAAAIATVYRELVALIQNGDTILRMLRRHNNGKDIDLDFLWQLILEQHVIIDRINTTLKQRKVRTVLAIHAPQLSPLQVLLEGKKVRLALLREEVGPARSRPDDILYLWRARQFGISKLPSNSSIDRSRRELRKIKAQSEELRKFIVDNFQVHEVV